jgi:hypothetical protein
MGGDVLFDCDLHGEAEPRGDGGHDTPPVNQVI